MSRSWLYSKEIRIILAGALLSIALPGVARAQTTTTTRETILDFPINGNNPCFNNEPFSGTGTQRNQETTSQTNGRFKSESKSTTQGNATSATARYNVFEMTEQEFISSARRVTIEFEDRNHFIRNGRRRDDPKINDDWFERFRSKLVITDGQITRNRSELRQECK
jgi:hypothetical protein